MSDRPASSPRRKAPRSRIASALRGAVVAFFSLALLYVVGVNLFLSSSLFEAALGRDPNTIAIGFDRGWSIIPGRIHCTNLVIRGRDSSLEWLVRIDDVDLNIALLPLLRKRFSASHIDAHGSSFRMRQRLAAEPKSLADIAHRPPIEGLPPWTLRPPKVQNADVWSDKAYHLWSVHLEQIDAEDVREIWVDDERFEGNADVRGRFYFKPLRMVDVGPVHAVVHEGMVSTKGPAVVSPILGTADVRIPPFDPRGGGGGAIARHLTLHTDMRGGCSNMLYFMHALPPSARVEGAVDVRRLAVKIEDGELRTGTHVDLAAPHTVLRGDSYRFDAGASLVVDVERERGVPTLRFYFESNDFTVRRRSHGEDGALIVGEPWAFVRGDATALALPKFLRDLHYVAEFPQANVPDMGTLEGFIPSSTPFHIAQGRAVAAVSIERWGAENRTDVSARVNAEDIDATLAKLRLHGRVDAEASFTTHPRNRSLVEDAKAVVTLRDASLAPPQSPQMPFVRTPELRLSAHAKTVHLEDPLANLEADVRMPAASVLDPHLLQAYAPGGSATTIATGRSDFALTADLSMVDHRAKGSLVVTANDLGFTYRDVDVTTALCMDAHVKDWDWQHGDLALDEASIELSNMRAGKRGTPPTSLGFASLRARSSHFSFDHPREELTLEATAAIPDARVLGLFLPPDSILAIESGRADLAADLDFSRTAPRTMGKAVLDVTQGSIVLRDRTHASGDLHFKAILSGEPIDHRFDISGSRVVTRNATVTNPGSETKSWNTDVILERGILGTRPLQIDAAVVLNSRDAREVMAGIVRHAPPMIVRRLTEVPHFEARAQISVGPSRIVVQDLEAHGGDITVHGLVGIRNEHHRGAFVVKKGLLSGGVRFDDAGAHAHIFGLDTWLRSQTDEVMGLVGQP